MQVSRFRVFFLLETHRGFSLRHATLLFQGLFRESNSSQGIIPISTLSGNQIAGIGALLALAGGGGRSRLFSLLLLRLASCRRRRKTKLTSIINPLRPIQPPKQHRPRQIPRRGQAPGQPRRRHGQDLGGSGPEEGAGAFGKRLMGEGGDVDERQSNNHLLPSLFSFAAPTPPAPFSFSLFPCIGRD